MTFNFTPGRFMILGLCLCLLVGLSFAAGLVAGIGLWMPTRTEIAALQAEGKKGEAVASVKPPAAIPVLGHAAQPEAAVPVHAPAPAAAPPATAPETHAPSVAPPPQPAAAAQASPPPQPAPSAQAPAPAEAEHDAFSLQVGSFLDAKNARLLQTDLKERGYADANVMTRLDSEQREWHVVRVGSYKTLAKASQAAVDFSSKERIQAVVRRSNSL